MVIVSIVGNSKIPLAQMIESLRVELSTAVERAKGSALQFELGEIELELQVSVGQSADGDGRVEFNVFGIGFGGGVKESRQDDVVHTFRLKLKPRASDERGGGTVMVSGTLPAGLLED